jgi:hypothetical protein
MRMMENYLERLFTDFAGPLLSVLVPGQVLA